MNDGDAKRLLKGLSARGVQKFIDADKLASSDEFITSTNFAVEHMMKHGDYIFVSLALRLISDSNSFSRFLHWLCDRAGLEFSFEQGDLHLSKWRNAKPKADSVLRDHTASKKGRGTAKDMAKEWSRNKAASSRRRKSVDIMDSWLVLPGCFEQGKRR